MSRRLQPALELNPKAEKRDRVHAPSFLRTALFGLRLFLCLEAPLAHGIGEHIE